MNDHKCDEVDWMAYRHCVCAVYKNNGQFVKLVSTRREAEALCDENHELRWEFKQSELRKLSRCCFASEFEQSV